MSFLNVVSPKHRLLRIIVTLVSAILVGFSQQGIANSLSSLDELNHLYQAFLNDHVVPGSKAGLEANLVDYPAVKKDPRLDTLLNMLDQYPKEKLVTNEDKIAFYLNAYNILAIDKVADNWPLFRLRSLGNFLKPVWTHPVPDVCGEKMTLRKLEHEILRALGDPRIHFALNCASMSCPDLRNEPYQVNKLEQQLEDQTRKFLSQKGKGYEIIRENKVKISPLFDWFEDDFEVVGGIESYVNKYLPSSKDNWDIVGYLDYNWDVNCHLSATDRRKLLKKKKDTWFD